MSKLWNKGHQLNELIERFTVADDYILDRELIVFDCYGTIAQAFMLEQIGILSSVERKMLHKALVAIIDDPQSLMITLADEDVHTALENALCASLGEAGKKIHTGRSRNDQVLVDLRLYMRQQLLVLMQELSTCTEALHTFATRYHQVPMVGRTHFQKAMPSSVGLWASALLESLIDNMQLLQGSYALINQCPLGSAASYGTALPLDRQLVSDLLGFDKVQNNVLYANNSRGKFESVILHSASQVMLDLSKYANDIIIFAAPEFGYFSLPDEFCLGSSLMPQKRNLCMLELMRAKCSTVFGYLVTVLDICKGLPTGYNRDFQETKRPFMLGIQTTIDSVVVFTNIIQRMTVNKDACIAAFTPEVFATDAALELIKDVPFREAYKQVALSFIKLKDDFALPCLDEVIQKRTHLGAPGNLGLEKALKNLNAQNLWLQKAASKHTDALAKLKTIT